MKLSQLILDKNVSEKIDYNITLPCISSILEGMSKGKVKVSIVDDPNILKVLFVQRVKIFETTVRHFVFKYLNSMKQFLNEKYYYINPDRVRNLRWLIDTDQTWVIKFNNKCTCPIRIVIPTFCIIIYSFTAMTRCLKI